VFLFTTAIISCKKDENQQAPENKKTGFGNISYIAKASGSGVQTTVKSSSTLSTVPVTWTSATIWVEKISFAGKTNNLLDTTIMVEKNLNIFSADALAGAIKLPSGSYKDVAVKLFCRKSPKSEFAFDFRGTFTNTKGTTDSVRVGSSYPFEANVSVTNIVIDPSDRYKATFYFDLSKVLTGISNSMLETTIVPFSGANNQKTYIIWKGGSADQPFYNQIIQNWQSVGSFEIIKEN